MTLIKRSLMPGRGLIAAFAFAAIGLDSHAQTTTAPTPTAAATALTEELPECYSGLRG